MATSDFTTNFPIDWNTWGTQTQVAWNILLDLTTDDPNILWIFGSSLVLFVSYWSCAAFFTFVDVTNKPKWILKYKIQRGKNEPVDKQKLWKALKQVLFNQTVVTILGLYIGNFFKYQTIACIRELPSMKTYIMDLVLLTVLEEVIFYYTHRILHYRTLYKYIHKKHHEWTSPIAAVTFYCHPVEHLFSNISPVALLTNVLNVHIVVAWTFGILAIVFSINNHSGFYFPFSGDSVLIHDYHHEKFNYNYGVFGWMDKLYGTYGERKNKKIC